MNIKIGVVCGVYLCLALVGMILIKMGGQDKAGGIEIWGITIGVKTFAGIFCYGCSFLIYTFVISQMQISLVIPILAALNSMGTILAGILIFKEYLSFGQLVGVAILILGIVVVGIYTK